jgi:hypothetical protein
VGQRRRSLVIGPWSVPDSEAGLWLRSVFPRRRPADSDTPHRRTHSRAQDGSSDDAASFLGTLAQEEQRAAEVRAKLAEVFEPHSGSEGLPTERALQLLAWALWTEQRVQEHRQRDDWHKFRLARSERREQQATVFGWILMILFTIDGGQSLLSGALNPVHLLHLAPW